MAAQQRHLKLSAIRLVALVGAVGAGLLTPAVDAWAPITAVILLLVALASQLLILTLQPEKQWYDGRAVAESVKMLTWKYQVGGDPFGFGVPEEQVDDKFLERLKEIVAEFRQLDLMPAEKNQITEVMRQGRQKPLRERQALYHDSRIGEQRAWYARKSEWNRVQALRWQVGLTVIMTLAILGAILRALALIPIDAYGLLAAVATAGVGWLQIKQHHGLARAYSVASHELAAINSRLTAIENEEDWKRFVDQAEEAISREHTLWRASRSV